MSTTPFVTFPVTPVVGPRLVPLIARIMPGASNDCFIARGVLNLTKDRRSRSRNDQRYGDHLR